MLQSAAGDLLETRARADVNSAPVGLMVGLVTSAFLWAGIGLLVARFIS